MANRVAELEAQLDTINREIKRLDLEHMILKQKIVENQLWQLRCKEIVNRVRKEVEHERSPYRFPKAGIRPDCLVHLFRK